jgi:hypothetical protein
MAIPVYHIYPLSNGRPLSEPVSDDINTATDKEKTAEAGDGDPEPQTTMHDRPDGGTGNGKKP